MRMMSRAKDATSMHGGSYYRSTHRSTLETLH
jgi:hypothetical protein